MTTTLHPTTLDTTTFDTTTFETTTFDTTTPHRTTPDTTTPHRPVRTLEARALDRLAAAAGAACDDARTRAVLAVVVQRLEEAADAGLGDTAGDPLVVLQRRFGRAHARLAGDGAGRVDSDLVLGLARALHAEPAGSRGPSLRPLATRALAAC